MIVDKFGTQIGCNQIKIGKTNAILYISREHLVTEARLYFSFMQNFKNTTHPPPLQDCSVKFQLVNSEFSDTRVTDTRPDAGIRNNFRFSTFSIFRQHFCILETEAHIYLREQ